jgi:hypothetical protein
VLSRDQARRPGAKARFESGCFSAGLKSSFPLLKQGAASGERRPPLFPSIMTPVLSRDTWSRRWCSPVARLRSPRTAQRRRETCLPRKFDEIDRSASCRGLQGPGTFAHGLLSLALKSRLRCAALVMTTLRWVVTCSVSKGLPPAQRARKQVVSSSGREVSQSLPSVCCTGQTPESQFE